MGGTTPSSHYSLLDLHRLFRQVIRLAPEIVLNGHRITIHDIRPNAIPAGRPVKEHVHSFYEGHLFLEGGGIYSSGREEEVGCGGTLLHAPHFPHAWGPYHSPGLRLLICFSVEPLIPVPRPTVWPVYPDLLAEFELLLNDIRRHQLGWADRVGPRLTTIISRILSVGQWPAAQTVVAQATAGLVTEIDQFFRDNLTRPLMLADVALHVGMSERNLCRRFSELTGVTVMERLMNLRMDRAAELLTETDFSLGAIGMEIGMPDPSYFCRRFRRHCHTTPTAYRHRASSLSR